MGKATTFYPIEKGLNNGILGCTGKEWKNPNQPYCASRTIPCGKWVRIKNLNTGDTAWCKIMDRGPYGKLDQDGNWFNDVKNRKRAEAGEVERKYGEYRSVLDMGKTVSDKLNSKGQARVRVRWWRNNELRPQLEELLVIK